MEGIAEQILVPPKGPTNHVDNILHSTLTSTPPINSTRNKIKHKGTLIKDRLTMILKLHKPNEVREFEG
jgi:flagellar basal body-associated protein FliL